MVRDDLLISLPGESSPSNLGQKPKAGQRVYVHYTGRATTGLHDRLDFPS